MGNQVKYVDLGLVSKEMYTALWEYGSVIDVKCPILLKFCLNKEMPTFFGKSEIDISHIVEDDIIEDIVRIYGVSDGGSRLSTVKYYIEGPETHNFILYSSSDVKQLFLQSSRECCFKFGIETFWNGRNDIFFKIGNKQKKFFGTGYDSVNGWHANDGSITYKFNSELANKVKALDINNVLKTPKFESNTGSVSDVVGGLWEVDSTIDPIKFNDEFLKILVKKLGGTLEKNNLSDEEMQLLISRGKKRLEDEEWMLRGNNENFI